MKLTKKEWLYNYMLDRGFSDEEARQYIEFNKRCNYEGMIRSWRKQATEEEKNRDLEEEYKEKYSPVIRKVTETIHEAAKRIRQEKESNLSMF